MLELWRPMLKAVSEATSNHPAAPTVEFVAHWRNIDLAPMVDQPSFCCVSTIIGWVLLGGQFTYRPETGPTQSELVGVPALSDSGIPNYLLRRPVSSRAPDSICEHPTSARVATLIQTAQNWTMSSLRVRTCFMTRKAHTLRGCRRSSASPAMAPSQPGPSSSARRPGGGRPGGRAAGRGAAHGRYSGEPARLSSHSHQRPSDRLGEEI